MWTKPMLEELNVNMTANGWFDTTVETLVLFNDNEKSKEDEKTPEVSGN